jgi:SGF29 tudor-like domain
MLAACQVTSDSEYILCKIISYDAKQKAYQVSDEDIESNKSTYSKKKRENDCLILFLLSDTKYFAMPVDPIQKLRTQFF